MDVAGKGRYRLYQYNWGILRGEPRPGKTFSTLEEVYDVLEKFQRNPYRTKWQYVIVQHYNTTAVGSRIKAVVTFDEQGLMVVSAVR